MSTLAERLRAETIATRPGPRCTLSQHLATLTPNDRAELIDVIKAPDINGQVISRHLAPVLAITADAIMRHRRGECVGCRDTGTFPRP